MGATITSHRVYNAYGVTFDNYYDNLALPELFSRPHVTRVTTYRKAVTVTASTTDAIHLYGSVYLVRQVQFW